MTNECGAKIKKLRTENGGEYTSRECEDFLKSRGIRHEVTVHYSPQQNGVVVWFSRTLQESALSQMCHANLPKTFWAEAMANVAYIRNWLPTSHGVTPFERWYGYKPYLGHTKVFTCIAYALKPEQMHSKMDPKTEKVRFIGYADYSKGYKLWDEVKQ